MYNSSTFSCSSFFVCAFLFIQTQVASAFENEIKFRFIVTRDQFVEASENRDVVVIASTGRSGSTFLYHTLFSFAPHKFMMKTHLLPPKNHFNGKLLFIFSNPDLAAESILRLTTKCEYFGAAHFTHMETSDAAWLSNLNSSTHQTITKNLLNYDALGCATHLSKWLHEESTPSCFEEAEILAIKYENLWDIETVDAIKQFLNLETLELPEKKARGYKQNQLSAEENRFRSAYNLGTFENPRYAAYDPARIIWEAAPPFQFLKLTNHN